MVGATVVGGCVVTTVVGACVVGDCVVTTVVGAAVVGGCVVTTVLGDCVVGAWYFASNWNRGSSLTTCKQSQTISSQGCAFANRK